MGVYKVLIGKPERKRERDSKRERERAYLKDLDEVGG